MSTLAQFLGGSAEVGLRVLLPDGNVTPMYTVRSREYLRTGVLVPYAAKYAGSIVDAPWLKHYGVARANLTTDFTAFGNNGSTIVGVKGNLSTTLFYSSNWVTWTAATSDSRPWKAVARVGSYFVAAGTQAVTATSVATSTDGITWTARHTSSASGSADKSIGYASSLTRWICIGTKAPIGSLGEVMTRAAADPQGVWTDLTPTGLPAGFDGLINSPSIFLLFAANDTNVYTSTDGTTWTARATGCTTGVRTAVWTGSYFIAVSQGSNTVFRKSTDGITWVDYFPALPHQDGVTITLLSDGAGVVLARGPYNVSSASSTKLWYSTDHGVTWVNLNRTFAQATANQFDGSGFVFCWDDADGAYCTATVASLTGNPDYVGTRDENNTDLVGGIGQLLGYTRIL